MRHDIEAARGEFETIAERFRDPGRARATLTVAAGLEEGLRMDLDVRGHRLTVDEPRSLGGTAEGPSPVELMLAALASCQAITYRIWAAKLALALEAVDVEADGDIDLRGYLGVDPATRPGFSKVRLRVRLQGPEPPERYRALAEAVDAHCPVLDVTGNPVPVERALTLPGG